MNSKGLFKRFAVLVCIGLISAVNAFVLDQAKIVINRALNSPTITVRYTGTSAALAELRVNGVSVSTRNLDSTKPDGETNFTLDPTTLREGDNEIEIRLFSSAGKLLGSEKQQVMAEVSRDTPVFIRTPKMGATVYGPVNIEVGFGKPLRNTYVSFFIDNDFKSMLNVAPFTFTWDTERAQNGWHELEAWIVDDNNQTLKTKRVKVFVNNPGGNTARVVTPKVKPIELTLSGNPTTDVVSNSVGSKVAPGDGKAAGSKLTAPKGNILPKIDVSGKVTSPAGLKATNTGAAISTSAKLMTPTGNRNAPNVGLVPITKGARLPDAEKFSIMYDSKFVNFDVQPRVTKGVPLTPFRHLFEQAGGEVSWDNQKKEVDARGMGKNIWIKIGELIAKVNGLPFELELAPFIERGRTIVPLSFISESLDVNVDYDKATGHVLITQAKKN